MDLTWRRRLCIPPAHRECILAPSGLSILGQVERTGDRWRPKLTLQIASLLHLASGWDGEVPPALHIHTDGIRISRPENNKSHVRLHRPIRDKGCGLKCFVMSGTSRCGDMEIQTHGGCVVELARSNAVVILVFNRPPRGRSARLPAQAAKSWH
jgi:hypothetical protein